MRAYPAEVAELVRAYRKDEEYKGHVRRQAHDITTHLFGARAMVANSRYVSLAADVAYYVATTVMDAQTLGEEYVGTVQVTSDAPPFSTPSIVRRLADVAMHTGGPLVLDRLLARAPLLDDGDDSAHGGVRAWLRENHATLARAHLGVFYVFARYYHLSKMRAQSDLQAARWFSYLGYATMLQCAISLAIDLHRRTQTARRKRQLDDTASSSTSPPSLPAHACPLCLSDSTSMSMAQCGHLACHECMHMQCSATGVCAECRMPIDEERCVPIFNL